MIEPVDESLSKALLECDYTKIRSCITSINTCKLSLYKIETDETGLKQKTRKAQIVEITPTGAFRQAKQIEVPNQQALIQEEILMNYTKKEVFVQVVSSGDLEEDPSIIELNKSSTCKGVLIRSNTQL